MKVGLAKSAVLTVQPRLGSGSLEVRDSWQFGDGHIGATEEYRYLGLLVNSELSLSYMSSDRVKQGRSMYNALAKTFMNKSIPPVIKLDLITKCLHQTILWGAEVWGRFKYATHEGQLLINQCMRNALGYGPNFSGVSIKKMQSLWGLHSVEALAKMRRVRAHLEYPLKRTFVSDMCAYPESYSWARGGELLFQKLNRNRALGDLNNNVSEQRVPEIVDGEIRIMRPHVEVLCRKAKYGVGAIQFLRWVTNASLTISRGAKMGIFDNRYTRLCPFCGEGVPETMKHLVNDCANWERERITLFNKLGSLREYETALDIEHIQSTGDFKVVIALTWFLKEVFEKRNSIMHTLQLSSCGPRRNATAAIRHRNEDSG